MPHARIFSYAYLSPRYFLVFSAFALTFRIRDHTRYASILHATTFYLVVLSFLSCFLHSLLLRFTGHIVYLPAVAHTLLHSLSPCAHSLVLSLRSQAPALMPLPYAHASKSPPRSTHSLAALERDCTRYALPSNLCALDCTCDHACDSIVPMLAHPCHSLAFLRSPCAS